MACAIIGTLMVIVFPAVTKRILDEVVTGHHPERLLPLLVVAAIAALLQNGLNSLRLLLNNTFEQKVIFDLRSDLYSHIQRPPLRWFDNRATGDLMTRILEDVTSVERVLIDGIEQGTVAVLQIIVVLAGIDALHAVAAFSRQDRRRLWTLAIDLHYVPYYGSRSTAGIVGGQKKQGTKFFHCYATAVLIHRRRRYAVGLLSVSKGLKPHEVVKTLLEQIRSRGLCVGGVVLDAGFDSGETILLLQEREVSYTVPLRRKGKGTNRRNTCYCQPSGTLATMEWVTEKSRKPVQTRVLVWQRQEQSQAKVYAFSGWGRATAVSEIRRAWLGRRRYRERFGIETSYRQKNQSRGWTTSASAEYRLLLEGLALVLRQVWVYLTQQIAKDRRLRPSAWVSELSLVEMLDWLVEGIQTHYPQTRCITLANIVLTINAPL